MLKYFSDSQIFINRKLKKIIKELSFDDFNLHSTLKMDSKKETEPLGEISIYEGLEKAKEIFKLSPLFYHKEIYMVLGSANSIDVGPIFELVSWFKEQNIRISIINVTCNTYLF